MADRVTLSRLASEIGIDLDEMLVSLWDCGLEQYDDPSYVLASTELKQVLRALSMPPYQRLRSAEHWLSRAGVAPDRVQRTLAGAGLRWRPGMRLLPVGAPWVLAGLGLSPVAAEMPPPCSPENTSAVLVAEPDWAPVGCLREHMRYLTLDEVLEIRRQIAVEFAKSKNPFMETGTYDAPLLESAVGRPQTSLGCDLKYPTVEMAAAALLHSLVLNHAFADGNKRTALVAMLVFLDENGFLLTSTERDLFWFVLVVAKHGLVRAEGPYRSDIEVLEAAHWISRHSRQLDMGERPLKWIKLKRLLRDRGATFEILSGNRINIGRVVSASGFLGRVRTLPLRTQVSYAGDGTEADKNTVAKIRRDLRLDETNGFDSRIFYDEADSVDDFIQLYRKTLHRLSQL